MPQYTLILQQVHFRKIGILSGVNSEPPRDEDVHAERDHHLPQSPSRLCTCLHNILYRPRISSRITCCIQLSWLFSLLQSAALPQSFPIFQSLDIFNSTGWLLYGKFLIWVCLMSSEDQTQLIHLGQNYHRGNALFFSVQPRQHSSSICSITGGVNFYHLVNLCQDFQYKVNKYFVLTNENNILQGNVLRLCNNLFPPRIFTSQFEHLLMILA